MHISFILGIVLFALGIIITIALHEAGHLVAARMSGMRVRRYFIGFGPKIFSFTKGNTEYGLKAIPLGGFCEIAGMTTLDELTDDEQYHAMYKKPWYKRVFVMSAGIIVNLLIAIIIIYGVAVAWGLPNNEPQPAVIDTTTCVSPKVTLDHVAECSGEGPAEAAGIQRGDTIVSVDGQQTPTFAEVTETLQHVAGNATEDQLNGRAPWSIPVVVQGPEPDAPRTLHVNVAAQQREMGSDKYTTAAMGITVERGNNLVRYNPATAIAGALGFTGTMIDGAFQGVLSLPSKVPGIIDSITGGERDIDGPMSVVGASRTGGELVQNNQWMVFFLLLASLNIFLALLNLVPLPPLDGGHIAVVLYEQVRNFFRRLRGLGPGEPVDYTKLLPLTYTAALILMAFGALVIVADIVNPITLFSD